jgi:phosphoribosylamine--glycine ligase
MKILFLSPDSSFSLAKRIEDEGHTVYCWTSEKEPYQRGIVKNIIKDWKTVAPKVDLIITDDVVLNDKVLKEIGKPTVSGNELFNKLENDRLFGKFAFQKAGLTTSDCVRFTDFKKAMEFVKANPGRWVFKANGQAARTLGFVAKDESGKDMLERLAFYEQHMKTNKKLWDKKLGVDFVLERAVDGIEIACGAYWDGKDFAGLNLNWEHKRLGVGNVGIATGEMGTAIHAISSSTRLYRDTLAKLKPLLQSSPYHSYVDLNMIVDKDNAYVLEITSRMGWPIEAALDSMSSIRTSERYVRLATNSLHERPFFKSEWGIALTVGTFGFPYEKAYEEFGADQPFSLPKGKDRQVYLYAADKVNSHLETSPSGEGLVMVVVGTADSLEAARDKAYGVVDDLDLPGKMYRTDIGEKVKEQVTQLKKWGWL